jgi:hypothetical protein
MSAPSDTLRSYLSGLESGAFDQDLSADDRPEVARLVRMALAVLDQYGATPARDLARMMRDPQSSSDVNDRVRDILFGTLTPGWSREGIGR